jgi:hypothetical protein
MSAITGLSKPIDPKEPFEFESDNEIVEVEIDLQQSMQEKLARANDKEINSKISSKSRTTPDVTSNVKKELFSKSMATVELILRAVTKV